MTTAAVPEVQIYSIPVRLSTEARVRLGHKDLLTSLAYLIPHTFLLSLSSSLSLYRGFLVQIFLLSAIIAFISCFSLSVYDLFALWHTVLDS